MPSVIIAIVAAAAAVPTVVGDAIMASIAAGTAVIVVSVGGAAVGGAAVGAAAAEIVSGATVGSSRNVAAVDVLPSIAADAVDAAVVDSRATMQAELLKLVAVVALAVSSVIEIPVVASHGHRC